MQVKLQLSESIRKLSIFMLQRDAELKTTLSSQNAVWLLFSLKLPPATHPSVQNNTHLHNITCRCGSLVL